MAKSIRSKRKKKFRAIKREAIYQPVVDARLEKCLSRLHKGSKVIEAPVVPEEPKRFSFAPFFTKTTTPEQDVAPLGMSELENMDMSTINPSEEENQDVDMNAKSKSTHRRRKKKVSPRVLRKRAIRKIWRTPNQ